MIEDYLSYRLFTIKTMMLKKYTSYPSNRSNFPLNVKHFIAARVHATSPLYSHSKQSWDFKSLITNTLRTFGGSCASFQMKSSEQTLSRARRPRMPLKGECTLRPLRPAAARSGPARSSYQPPQLFLLHKSLARSLIRYVRPTPRHFWIPPLISFLRNWNSL